VAVGLYINSYLLATSGTIDLFEIPDAARTATRDALRQQLGVNVFVLRDDAFTYAKPPVDGRHRAVRLSPPRGLGLFAVREALLEHCIRQGASEAWPGRAGELYAKNLLDPISVDRFQLDSETGLRLSEEEFLADGILLTVRHRRSWRTVASLADPEVAVRALGLGAVRIGGDGPARGRIEKLAAGNVKLMARGIPYEAHASSYALAATTALVASWRGTDVLRAVRVAAGDVMQNGRANPAAIRDRFLAAGKARKMLGESLPIAGTGSISIPSQAVEVRLEVDS
jgi:hypothetical protein